MLGSPLQETRSSSDAGGAVKNGRPASQHIRIGTVNILTLTDKTEELVNFMIEKDIAILGLSETKWRGRGERQLKEGYRLFYSGGQEARNGVGLIIRKDVQY